MIPALTRNCDRSTRCVSQIPAALHGATAPCSYPLPVNPARHWALVERGLRRYSMQRSRRLLLCALVAALALTACKNTGFLDSANPPVITKAGTWLTSQQLADGSFEVGGFAGFETPDAIVAIAERAQTSSAWDTTKARNGVLAVTKNGKSALDAMDDFADGTLSAGQAAKLIVLVATPLGLDSLAFDPQGDGARNLVGVLNQGEKPDGSFGAFNATLYAAIAKRIRTGRVPTATLALIRNAQQANGGWNFSGDATGTDLDIDTTALALQALVAAKVTPTDADLVAGLQLLADQQRVSGPWRSFGSNDPNSTATAIMAVTAAGFDPTNSCWRDTVRPALKGTAYPNPVDWLRTQQATDGHITSPNDSFPPVNTFATTQSIEALARGWLPVAWLAPRSC